MRQDTIWEAKFDRFIANAVGALIQLVDRHWELLVTSLAIQEFRGDTFCRDKHLRRLHHHLELRQLRSNAQLHRLRQPPSTDQEPPRLRGISGRGLGHGLYEGRWVLTYAHLHRTDFKVEAQIEGEIEGRILARLPIYRVIQS